MNEQSKTATISIFTLLLIAGYSNIASAQTQYPILETINRQTAEIKNIILTDPIGASGNSNFVRSTKRTELNINNANSAPVNSSSAEKCEKSNRFIECDHGQYRSIRIAGCLHYIDTTNSQVIERFDYSKIGAPEININYSLTSSGFTFKFENTLQLKRITSAQEIGWDIPGPVLVYEWRSRQALNNDQQMQAGSGSTVFYSTYLNCTLDEFKKMTTFSGNGTVRYQATIEYKTADGKIKTVSREVTHTHP